MENIQQQAIEHIQHSRLDAELIAQTVALIPTIPFNLILPHCSACESVLCGECHRCHSFALRINDPICLLDREMGSNCAAWWQAFLAVTTAMSESKGGDDENE